MVHSVDLFAFFVFLRKVFGGYHKLLYTGSIFYTPIVKEDYYSVLIVNISIGGIQVNLDCTQVRTGQ